MSNIPSSNRVAKAYQGQAVGKSLFQYLIDMAKSEHYCLVPLTTPENKQ